jgi:flagellar biogenesis protein FliO
MKVGMIVIGLFVMIAFFLFVWYNIEKMQDELEHEIEKNKKDQYDS